MKKIINGKLYDTDKARHLGTDSFAGPRDFKYWREELYQKRTGEFFLYGEGGPLSRYAVASSTGSGWTGGERITPLNATTAREWAEEHLSADLYQRIFTVPEEPTDERAVLHVQLPADLVARIRAEAVEEGVSLTAWVEHALRRSV